MKNLKQYITEKLRLDGPSDYAGEYFYHEALGNGYSTKLINTKNALQYSIDNCNTWKDLNPQTDTPQINKGQRIYFKGENMECIKREPSINAGNNGIGRFESNEKFNCGGNIMSLIYGDDFKEQTNSLEKYQFYSLFRDNTYLISAKNLVLPATELSKSCYNNMFKFCTSLNEGPELPATKLAEDCYNTMFMGCESLNNAPELLASELIKGCYVYMFRGCEKLNKITMTAKSIEKIYRNFNNELYDYLWGWLDYVSETGTITKSKDFDLPIESYGRPEGWTTKEI